MHNSSLPFHMTWTPHQAERFTELGCFVYYPESKDALSILIEAPKMYLTFINNSYLPKTVWTIWSRGVLMGGKKTCLSKSEQHIHVCASCLSAVLCDADLNQSEWRRLFRITGLLKYFEIVSPVCPRVFPVFFQCFEFAHFYLASLNKNNSIFFYNLKTKSMNGNNSLTLGLYQAVWSWAIRLYVKTKC